MTPQERFAELLRRYPHGDESDQPEFDQIALVEESHYDGSYWVTTHATFVDAASYRTGQECPEDWDFETLVWLATGRVYDEHVKIEYRPTDRRFPT